MSKAEEEKSKALKKELKDLKYKGEKKLNKKVDKKALRSKSGESTTVSSERKEEMNLDLGVYADGKPAEKKPKYLPEKTQEKIKAAGSHAVDGKISQLSAVPTIAYGVVDIVGGEKVTGVVAIAKGVPAVVKGKIQETKAKIEITQAGKTLNDEMEEKRMTKTERKLARKEFAEFSAKAVTDKIKNKPKEVKKDIKEAGDAIKEISGGDKKNQKAIESGKNVKAIESGKKSDVHAKRVKQAEARLSLPASSEASKGPELGE